MSSRPDQSQDMPQAKGGGTVLGLFTDRAAAEAGVRALKEAGFTDQDIGMIMQDPGTLNVQGEDPPTTSEAGAVDGSLIGGLIGLLASLPIPGVGPLLLGGVLASTLAGAGLGATTGGLIGILVGAGASASQAEYLERGIRRGGILLTVNPGERLPEAMVVLERHGSDLGLSNRRFRTDPDYPGPERRVATV